MYSFGVIRIYSVLLRFLWSNSHYLPLIFLAFAEALSFAKALLSKVGDWGRPQESGEVGARKKEFARRGDWDGRCSWFELSENRKSAAWGRRAFV